jgi:hypothetical protein
MKFYLSLVLFFSAWGGQYYCTYADARHFNFLLNLIGSIHHVDYDRLGEIMVFDLGLNKNQKQHLSKIDKVNLYEVEKVNSDITKPFISSPGGKVARGWFTWKPVVIKQALEKYPYVLCIDSGITVLKSLEPLFNYIRDYGYFLISNLPILTCNIESRVTREVLNKVINKESKDIRSFLLKKDTIMISAGLQGVSRDLLDDYVLPMYEYAHNPTLFRDDKTAKKGFGEARHDQTLFSILAHKLKLKIHPEGWTDLDYKDKNFRFHTTSDRKNLVKDTTFFISKLGISRQMKRFITYK